MAATTNEIFTIGGTDEHGVPAISRIKAAHDIASNHGYSHDHLPGFMSTYEGQVRKIAELLLQGPANEVTVTPATKRPRDGAYTNTRTFFLQDRSGRHYLIAFRTEQLARTNDQYLAERLLDKSAVPSVWHIHDPEALWHGIHVYFSERPSGISLEALLFDQRDAITALLLTVPSIGRLLVKDGGPDDLPADRAVPFNMDHQLGCIRAHLDLILADTRPQVRRWHGVLHKLAKALPRFVDLPLMPGHYDIQPRNVIVHADWTVSCLIGWNSPRAGPQGTVQVRPFGMALAFIHRFGGRIHAEADGSNAHFRPLAEFPIAEQEFWAAIWESLPEATYDRILPHVDIVDDAIRLGTFLEHFPVIDDGAGGFGVRTAHPALMEALPFFLSYCSPCSRQLVDGEPYDEAHELSFRKLLGEASGECQECDIEAGLDGTTTHVNADSFEV